MTTTRTFRCGADTIALHVPGDAVAYESAFPAPAASAAAIVGAAVDSPLGTAALETLIRERRNGPVVVVVSDITRPIPYAAFLPRLLARIEAAGVGRDEITVLVATGMHRVSTPAEHREMFGDVAGRYRIVDHDAENDRELVALESRTHSGASVKIHRHLAHAGLRILTGLVEPHFMAGFSGGRKSVCPGLVDLQTVRNFHGQAFLADRAARNANLDGNPLHDEALSVARVADIDFTINVVLDSERRVVAAHAGELEQSHLAACDFVRSCACPTVETPADIAITSSGGYPLDATFYQCVKGFVSCLPAVRPGGTIIAFGGCAEGIGSTEYTRIMMEHSGRWRDFLRSIAGDAPFIKDQWQFQMHARTLERVGQDNLLFATAGLDQDTLAHLSVNPLSAPAPALQHTVQTAFDTRYRPGMTVALFPEGPYCAPVER